VSLFVVIGFGCTGIREDELACEDAVSHLQECCTGFGATNIDCTYEPGGCDSSPQYPALSIDESACIRGQSCAALVANGVCQRAMRFPENGGVCR
jgi:hypothetical protein